MGTRLLTLPRSTFDDVVDPHDHLGSFVSGHQHMILHLERLRDLQLSDVANTAAFHVQARRLSAGAVSRPKLGDLTKA